MNEREIRRTIVGLYIFRICMGGMASCIPIIVVFWKTYNLSLTQITLLQSFFAFLLLLLEVPSGYIADIWGRKKALVSGGILFSMGAGTYLFADCYYHFILAEIFCALGFSLISGADAALLYDALKNHKQENEYEKIWGSIMAYSLIGYGIFNTLGGILYSMHMRLPFLLATAILLVTIPATCFIKEPSREKLTTARGYSKTLLQIIVPTLMQNRAYRQLLVIYAWVFTGIQVALWLYQPYFQSCGIAPFWFGFIFTSFNIVAALGSKYAEQLDEFSMKLPYGVLPLISVALSYLLMGFYSGTLGFMIIFLQQLIRGWFTVSISRQVNTIITSKERATLLSFCTMSGSCLYTLFLPVMGIIADALTIHRALIIGGMSCLGLATIGFLRPIWSRATTKVPSNSSLQK